MVAAAADDAVADDDADNDDDDDDKDSRSSSVTLKDVEMSALIALTGEKKAGKKSSL